MESIKKEGVKWTPSLINYVQTGECSTVSLRYKNYVPIDYIKAEILKPEIKLLLSISDLNFTQPFNIDSGELLEEVVNQKGKRPYKKKVKRIATFRGMKFIYYPETGRVFIAGSFHKYYYQGLDNSGQFHQSAFNCVLNDFYHRFAITSHQIHIEALEWGVNSRPPINSETMIQHCIDHRLRPFAWKIHNSKGKYKQAEYVEYSVKLYDKALHCGLEEEAVRVEVHCKRWDKYTQRRGIGRTLADLIESDFKGMRDMLLNAWKEVIFFDPFIEGNNPKVFKYRDPIHWDKRRVNKQYTTKKNDLDKLKRFNRELGQDIQVKMTEQIEYTLDQLNSQRFINPIQGYTWDSLTIPKHLDILCTHYSLSG